uniref:Uncharacterized protein n=1 Tax=Rhizophagus irregularis (strain DAOM 181602 / DAOM 197198 / MUCL 43194) TaxID=747089 RepID=U9URF2_RHIID
MSHTPNKIRQRFWQFNAVIYLVLLCSHYKLPYLAQNKNLIDCLAAETGV